MQGKEGQIMTGWQPIETAPAGIDLLLLFEGGEQRVGYFNGGGWLMDGTEFELNGPCYWMPLPQPPEDKWTTSRETT